MAKRRRRSHKRAEEPKKRHRRRHHRRSEARENPPKHETGSLLIAGLVGVAAGAAVFWAFTTTNAFQQYYTNQLASGQISPS